MSLQITLNTDTLQTLLQVENLPRSIKKLEYKSAIESCLKALTDLAKLPKEEIIAINGANWEKIQGTFEKLNQYVTRKGPQKSYLSDLHKIDKIKETLNQKRGNKFDQDLAFRIYQMERTPFLLKYNSNKDHIAKLFITNLKFLISQTSSDIKKIEKTQWETICSSIHQLSEQLKKDSSQNSQTYRDEIIKARNALLDKRHRKRVF